MDANDRLKPDFEAEMAFKKLKEYEEYIHRFECLVAEIEHHYQVLEEWSRFYLDSSCNHIVDQAHVCKFDDSIVKFRSALDEIQRFKHVLMIEKEKYIGGELPKPTVEDKNEVCSQ